MENDTALNIIKMDQIRTQVGFKFPKKTSYPFFLQVTL